MSARLERHIGLFALTLYGIGDILGAGIYGLVGKAAGVMGSGVWLAFLVSLVIAMLTGLSYASLGSQFPKAAGSAYVLLKAFGSRFFAYVAGLLALASGLTSMATGSRVFAGYLHGFFPTIPISIGAVILLTLLGFIVWRGIRESMWVNSLSTLIELSGLLIIIFIGVKYWGSVDYFDFKTVENPSGEFSPSLMLSGAVLVFYSFIGFEDLLNVGEEAKNPERNLPIALLVALFVSSIVYVAVSITAISVIPAEILAQSNQPLVDVVKTAAPWFPAKMFSVIALVAVSNTVLLNFIMGSRLLYGLSRLRVIHSFLDHIDVNRKTPSRAILFVYGIVIILALSGDISSLARATSLLLLLVFVGMNLSLIRIKRRDGVPKGRLDIPLFVPVLGAFFSLVLICFGQTKDWLIAGALLVLIVISYLVAKPSAEAMTKMMEMEED